MASSTVTRNRKRDKIRIGDITSNAGKVKAEKESIPGRVEVSEAMQSGVYPEAVPDEDIVGFFGLGDYAPYPPVV